MSELQRAAEAYWRGETDADQLLFVAMTYDSIRRRENMRPWLEWAQTQQRGKTND